MVILLSEGSDFNIFMSVFINESTVTINQITPWSTAPFFHILFCGLFYDTVSSQSIYH